jgi:hypothetical protein
LASSITSTLAIVGFHAFVGPVNEGIEPAIQGNAQPISQCGEAKPQTEILMIFWGIVINYFYLMLQK